MKTINPYKYYDRTDYYRRVEGKGYALTKDLRFPLKKFNKYTRKFISIQNGRGQLSASGVLYLYTGFCWNGSNFSIDSSTGLLAALVHDALCEIINEYEYEDRGFGASAADWQYWKIMVAQGTSRFRAGYHWLGVRLGSMLRLVGIHVVLALALTGCLKAEKVYWIGHRGQVFLVTTNEVPEEVYMENVQEGGSNLNGVKLR